MTLSAEKTDQQLWAWVAGASEGLGLAFADELAKRGYHLLLFARRAEVLNEQAERLRTSYKVKVEVCCLDLSDANLSQELSNWVQPCPPKIAIYNAAFAPVGDFVSHSEDILNQVIDVNVRAPMVWSRVLGEALPAGGGLLLMSSLAGQQGSANISIYAASKSFNTTLAESLWFEFKQRGITVLACCAGAIRTPGYSKTADQDAPGTLDASTVARQALDRLSKASHGPRFVPGWINKIASLLIGRLLPRRVAVTIMSKVTQNLF